VGENALEQAALGYISRGWSVIPLRYVGSIEDRKKPLLRSWQEYQRRIPTEAEIRDWWKEWPSANIGIPTGKVSQLVVIDLDGPNCHQLFEQRKVHLGKTAAVQTGRGYHVYYVHPGNGHVIQNRVKFLTDGLNSHVDVRADGGYVVAPPSIHGNGRIYQWTISLEALSPLPDDFISLFDDEHEHTGHPTGEDWISGIIDGVTAVKEITQLHVLPAIFFA
jgi:hypothetical protein